MKVYSSISELVGHTPLVQLQRFAAARGLKANLLAKVEYFNPSSSRRAATPASALPPWRPRAATASS